MSQIAKKKFPITMLLGRLSVNLNHLTRKGRPFVVTKLHQVNIEKIKKLLTKLPVLTLPNGTGRLILYSDTSKTHTGSSSLWQVQNGRPRLLSFASKSLPKAARNYSITELEMTGLKTNMEIWQQTLGNKNFDAAVDHKSISQIMKAKNLPHLIE